MSVTAIEIPRVALDFMNDDHARVIELVNNLLDLLELNPINNSAVEQGLQSLLQDCRDHFAREEVLMQQYSFPPYGCHKNEHETVLQQLEQTLVQWQGDVEPSKVFRYLDDKFIPWLSNHVSTMDFVTAHFLARSQALAEAGSGS